MASIRLEQVEKVYPNGHVAARGLDLTIADGELLVLVGPSGSGKSTAMRMIAGLESPTAGRIWIGERDMTDVPPQERDLAMVFQSYALYPHKTVAENLAFGLRMRGLAPVEIAERVRRVADALGLAELLERKPAQLSGGQRQRVALGRAIVREPNAFLLDEPLSNLDPKLRVRTRAELARLHRRLKATMVYVTHDQEEAMTLGDRVAVMNDAHVQQVGPPLELYQRPANVFVAGFMGSPEMNLYRCEVERAEGRVVARSGGFRLELAGADAHVLRGAAVVGIRPQDVELAATGDADLSASVELVEPLGSEALVHLTLGDGGDARELRAVVPEDRRPRSGDVVGLRLRRDRVHLFDGDSGARLPVSPAAV